jgi:hypothetical protein
MESSLDKEAIDEAAESSRRILESETAAADPDRRLFALRAVVKVLRDEARLARLRVRFWVGRGACGWGVLWAVTRARAAAGSWGRGIG